MKTHFADPADLLNFALTITPDEGNATHFLGLADGVTVTRNVQGWRIRILFRDQHQLPT